MQHLFRPFHTFVACGTWSWPEFSPLPKEVAIVNAGIEPGVPYDVWYNQYWNAAATAACAYLLNRKDWDLSVMLNYDALVGAVNFKDLLNEFMARKEVFLSEAWYESPGGCLLVWKRQACCDYLHCRMRANIVKDKTGEKPLLSEFELKKIFTGTWWNPWPGICTRQDYGHVRDDNPIRVLAWPFVSQPNPIVIQPYIETQYSRAIPV